MADPLTWDMFILPVGFEGEAIMEYQGRSSQIIAFTVTRDWVRRDAYLIVDGLGDSLIDARLSTHTESWMVNPASGVASRTNRFGTELQEAGETNISPIGALRPVIERAMATEDIPSELGANGRRVQVSKDGFVMEFDIVNREVVSYREMRENTKVAFLEIHYRDWMDLPSGRRIPTTIETNRIGNLNSAPVTTVHRIQSPNELVTSVTPPPFVVPGGFTVADHFEGVTKGPDGRVLGPIERGQRLASHGAAPNPGSQPGGGPNMTRLLIGAGVLLVAIAGFIAMKRRS
jgi:hypothetical protein